MALTRRRIGVSRSSDYGVRTYYEPGNADQGDVQAFILLDADGNVITSLGGGGSGYEELTLEATYPKFIEVTTGGLGVEGFAANADRLGESYLQNLNDVTTVEYTYGTSITTGEAGKLAPGEKLYMKGWQGAVWLYQDSGSSVGVWAVSFI